MGKRRKIKKKPPPPKKPKKHPKLNNVLPRGKRNRKIRQKQHNDLVDAFQGLSVEKPLTTEEKLSDIYSALASIKLKGPQENDLKL